jgi:excisionase family DNA binding protein
MWSHADSPSAADVPMTSRVTGVTVVNSQAWALRPEHIPGLLQRAAPGAVIADPAGAPADPDRLATVTDPQFWSGHPAALAEALATSPPGQAPIAEGPPTEGRSSGAASTSAPGRLTLTVEEAAALLGISRAFAYEAVRRGEIPSIRIGRRVLVPRVARDLLINGPSDEMPSASDPG